MSTNAAPIAEVPQPAPTRKLRIWPAIPFFLYIVGAEIAQPLITEWSPLMFNLLLFGPIICAGALVLWLLFFSRIRWTDRLIAVGGAFALGAASYFASHPSMREMGFISFVIPISVIAFTATLFLLSRFNSRVCVVGALVVGAIALAYWDCVRYDGMWGDFKSAMPWRWQKSSEDTFLAELSNKPKAPSAKSTEPLGKVTWPEFRGAKRDGSVPGIVLDVDWTTHKPKQLWKRKVGPGWSSFVVAGNRLFTQEQRGKSEDVVCYDAKTGDELWVHESPARFSEAMGGDGPRATPTLASGLLYSQGATGLLVCLDPVTGDVKWEHDLKKETNRATDPMWGYSSSPLVTGDVVIAFAAAGGNAGGGVKGPGQLLAYDVASGKQRWTADAGGDSYSSPQISKVAGRDVVLFLANNGLTAIDAKSGKVAWNYDWESQGHRVVQPLLVSDSSLVLGTGMDKGTRRIEVVANKGDVEFEDKWTSMAMKPDFNDYVAFDGFLYGLDHNILSCIDLATGEKKWKNGRYGNGQMLLLPDAGQLLILSEQGDLVLVQANPKKLDQVASQKVLEGKTWNHPVLVGNRVYVRNAEEAACFELPLAGQSTGDKSKAATKEL